MVTLTWRACKYKVHKLYQRYNIIIFTLRSPLTTNQQPDSIQNSSHLLPHCLWYSSSIPRSPSCFNSTLLLVLFDQPRILGSSVCLWWAGGPWGRDPFNTSDLWSGPLFLSLSGIRLHSLLSQNWKPTSSLLHADLSFFLFFIVPTHHH